MKDKLKEGIHVVSGDQWPIFMWKDEKYDESDPWKGLLRSTILIKVSCTVLLLCFWHCSIILGVQARFHFTKFGRSGSESNMTRQCKVAQYEQGQYCIARLHCNAGKFLITSLVCWLTGFIATIWVRFTLSLSLVFTRSDSNCDSIRFYNTMVTFLEDPDEEEEVSELLLFWNQWAPSLMLFKFHHTNESDCLDQNRLIFLGYLSSKMPITKDSALARLKQRRVERLQLRSITNGCSGQS